MLERVREQPQDFRLGGEEAPVEKKKRNALFKSGLFIRTAVIAVCVAAAGAGYVYQRNAAPSSEPQQLASVDTRDIPAPMAAPAPLAAPIATPAATAPTRTAEATAPAPRRSAPATKPAPVEPTPAPVVEPSLEGPIAPIATVPEIAPLAEPASPDVSAPAGDEPVN